MALSLRVGTQSAEIGAPSFLHAFFSTVSRHCEPGGWGTAYPHLMRELYQGRLAADSAAAALAELADAKQILLTHPPSDVVWDIEKPSARPPWGDNISPRITSLGNYFVTSAGRDLFAVLEELLTTAEESGQDATIG